MPDQLYASDIYPVGQCTYYVAGQYPKLNTYGSMGNAIEWMASARANGFTVTNRPIPDTVAVFGPGGHAGYSALGHVAKVESINKDGSYNVSEMNFNGWNVVDQRRVTPGDELGFFIPPGSAATVGSTQVAAGGCITNWNLPFGNNLCMDGVVGGAAMAAGGVIMLVGTVVLVALTITKTGIGKAATGALGGPVGIAGKAVQAQQRQKAQHTAKPRATPTTATALSVQEQKAASQARVARARARVSSLSDAELDERYGTGTAAAVARAEARGPAASRNSGPDVERPRERTA